ncbi:GNAT family N-acetyltransferase [Niveibacterium sp. SC-1]|uniref:GNAT family N-acetyltransferase n=1 Tax=Niveibacterium sp. SC-1 TaxID=3135646 RepID=UPI00311E3676
MTATVQISMARPGDAVEIADMSRRLIEHGLPWSWRPERVARSIAARNTNVAVVREQGVLVGFGIMEYWDEDAHLVLFAVRRESRRRGIGTAILHWLEASARVAGSERIRVECRRANAAARCFYNEHGYHELSIRQRMYGGADAGIYLEKRLRGLVTPGPSGGDS